MDFRAGRSEFLTPKTGVREASRALWLRFSGSPSQTVQDGLNESFWRHFWGPFVAFQDFWIWPVF